MSGWLDGRSLFKKTKDRKRKLEKLYVIQIFMRIEIVNPKTSKQINKLNFFVA